MACSSCAQAKYAERVFAADREPGDWLIYAPLANGWSRHLDDESKAFYFSDGVETVWDHWLGGVRPCEPFGVTRTVSGSFTALPPSSPVKRPCLAFDP